MPIARIQMEDGRIGRFKVPDGTTPEQIKAFISSKFNSEPEQKPKKDIGTFGALRRGAEQGLTFGFMDEGQAAIASGIGWLADKYYGNENRSWGDNYSDAKMKLEEELEIASEKNPLAYLGGNIAGGAVTGIAGLSKIPNALKTASTTLGRRGREALMGAMGAGVYGVGNAKQGEDLGDAFVDNAAAGFITAPILGAAMSGIGSAGSKILKKGAKATGEKLKAGNSKLADDAGDIELVSKARAKNANPDRIYADTDKLPEAIPLSKGQVDNNLPQLRQEYRAEKAILGEKSKAAIDSLNDAQKQAIEKNIIGLNKGGIKNKAEVGEEISDFIGKDYKKLKGEARKLYNSSAKPLQSSSIKQTKYFDDVVTRAEKELQTFPLDIQESFGNEINRIIKRNAKGKIDGRTSLDLQQIENLRKSLNKEVFRNSQDKVKGAAASKIVNILDDAQDNWLMDNLVKGDTSSIQAIKQARAKYAQIKKKYTGNFVSNKIRKDIIGVIENGDELAPEAVFNAVYGFSKTGKNSEALKLINTLSNYNDGALKPVLRQGLFSRIYQKSLEHGSDNVISVAKMRTELNSLLNDNPTIVKKVFSGEDITQLRELKNVLNVINRKNQEGVRNPSGSGIFNYDSFLNLVDKFPAIGPLVTSGLRNAKDYKIAAEVGRKQLEQEIFGGAGKLGGKSLGPIYGSALFTLGASPQISNIEEEVRN